MAKISLGKRPTSFKRTVSVKLLDGSVGTIGCTFKYRTRREFGELIDSLADAAQADGDERADAATPDGLAALMSRAVDSNAAYLAKVLDGWDLDVDLSAASLEQLCDELPGAAASIMEDYRLAVVDGRLGN